MKISEFLTENSVIPDLSARSKEAVIQELCRCLISARPTLKLDRLVTVLLEREKLGSTGIGDGVAIPHAKLPDLPGLAAAFGLSKEGVNFEAIDGKPTYLFFLLMAPENSAGIHLKALARISRLFKNREFRSAIQKAATGQEIYSLICQEDAKA